MAWRIHKSIDFCYGHRVYTQRLNKDFAIDTNCKCRHLHGHQGTVVIHLSGDTLVEDTGMVTDFRHLEWLKVFIDKYLDHHFVAGLEDPLIEDLVWGHALVPVTLHGQEDEHILGWTLDLEDVEPGTPEYEYLEGFFLVDFVPTSEKLSEWIYQLTQSKMSEIGVKVDRAEWWETPKSCSVYEA